MSLKEKFLKEIEEGYTYKGDSLLMGTAMLDKTAVPNMQIKIPLENY